MRQQGAGEPCEKRRNDERQRAVTPGVDTDRFSQFVLPVDGMKRQSDARALQPVQNQQRHRHDQQTQIVIIDRIEKSDADIGEFDIRKRRQQFNTFGAAERFAKTFPA
jgi:hypothetical protein